MTLTDVSLRPDIKTNDITIVFITHNSGHLLKGILGQLNKYNVMIFDNASTDDTLSILQEQYPTVEVIPSSINHGYGRAANKAFRHIDTRYALLLNPDIEIKIDALNTLIETTQQLGDHWLFVAPNTGEIVKFSKRENTSPLDTNSLRKITCATGCALLFNCNQYWSLDGFDENIFLFFEEIDLCRRADNKGIAMHYAEHIHLPHGAGKSVKASSNLSALRQWHFQWSLLYYIKKHNFWIDYHTTVIKHLLFYPIKEFFLDNDGAKRCRTRRAATKAFIRNKAAFNDQGQPFIPNTFD